MNNRTRDLALFDQLRDELQREAGTSFQVEAILALSPVMTEIKVIDKASNRPFCARLYRLAPEQREMAHQTWQMCAPEEGGPPRKLPQSSYGLKTMGTLTAHVGAYLPGMDLATYLTHVPICQAPFVVRTGIGLLRMLDVLSQHKVPHYAVAPREIIITKESKILIKNAGLSIFETMLARKMGLDTLVDPLYAAPEQISGQGSSHATDIYRTGLVLYEMAAGRPPFVGSAAEVGTAQCERPVPNPQSFNPDVDLGLIRVIAKALAKQPDQRFSSFAEMRQALEMLLPPVERFALSGSPNQVPSDPKEEERVKQQIVEAHGYAQNRDFASALRTLDTLMMMTGPREDALSLYRKVWQAENSKVIKTCLDKAHRAADQNDIPGSLSALHHLLSLQPLHPSAREMQAGLFDRAERIGPAGRAAVDFAAYKKLADHARGQGNALLSRGLTYDMATLSASSLAPNDQTLSEEAKQTLSGLGGPAPLDPGDELVDFDDLDLDHLDEATADAPATLASLPPLPDPPPTDPVAEADDPLAFDENEDLLGIPEETSRPAPPSKPKKKFPLVPVLGAAAVVLLVLIVFVAFSMMQGRKRAAGMEAYGAADQLEQSGEWDAALREWAAVGEAYPDMNFPDGTAEERYKILEYKIKAREKQVGDNLARATELLSNEEDPISEMEDNPVTYLANVLLADPGNMEAAALMETIRVRETERANSLWEEGKVMEARDVHDFLVNINPDYRVDELATGIDAWIEENVIGPRLANLDRAIKRKQWEKAIEIGEGLEETLEDPRYVRERWDKVFAEYDEALRTAQAEGNQQKMLAALEVMTTIRPDDQALMEEKDRLNRSLNLARILDLEKKINAALGKDNLITAVGHAVRLRRMESENQIANNAISTFRGTYEKRIEQQKQGNPRAALTTYDTLIKQLNWRMHRKAKTELQGRVNNFDSLSAQLLGRKVDNFADYKSSLDGAINDYSDFSNDQTYARLIQTRESLVTENTRLQDILRWEESVRDDIGTPYRDVLRQLEKVKSFRYDFGKVKIAQILDSYKKKIENYSGTVTLVIKGARGLPGSRRTRAYCRLETSGEAFTTEVANGRDPNWFFTSTYTAQAGAPLNFKIFNKRGDKLIGEVSLNKIPEDTKDLALKPDQGKWSLILDVKRER